MNILHISSELPPDTGTGGIGTYVSQIARCATFPTSDGPWPVETPPPVPTGSPFLGTRMHATILVGTAGMPIAGIGYEFKVQGWFDRLGIGDLVVPLEEMDQPRLWNVTSRLVADETHLRAHLSRAIPAVQTAALDSHRRLAGIVTPTGAAPTLPVPRRATDTEDPRTAWEQESAHHDVVHARLRRIIDLAESMGGERLLDVGCSAGTIGTQLAPHLTYHGCDISQAAVRSGTRGWLVAADLEQGVPPFDGHAYDVIVCSGILEYIEDPAALLRSLAERLTTDGQLIVSYFNMRHVSRSGDNPFRHPLWRNDFSPASFRSMLESAGWHIESTHWSTAGHGPSPDARDEAAATTSGSGCFDNPTMADRVPSTPGSTWRRVRSSPSSTATSFRIRHGSQITFASTSTSRRSTPPTSVASNGESTPGRWDCSSGREPTLA